MAASVPPKSIPLMRRAAVVRLLVIAFLAEIGYAVLNISTMPVYLNVDRGFGEFSIALILMAFLLSEAVFKGPMGSLADRYGCKRLMVVGPCLTFGTSLLSLVVPHNAGVWETGAFVLLRVLDGIGAAMLWPAAFSMMGHVVEDHERQQGMSLLNMCYLLGIAIALPVGGIAEDLTQSKAAGLYLGAVLFLAVFLAIWRLLPSEEPEGEASSAPKEGFQVRQFLQSMRQIPGYLALAMVTFAGIGFPMAIIKIFAKDEFRMSGAAFGALVMPGAIAMALFSVPMSKYGERIGRVKAVHFGMGLCAAGLAVISLGGFFSAFRSPWILAIGGIPVGIGFLLAIPAWLTAVSDIDPRNRGSNLGAVMTAQGLGAIIGLPLGGLMYEKLVPVGVNLGLGTSFGHYSPFLGCAICVTAGWLLGLRILREPKPVTRSA